jgi:hypothetical protein
LGLQAQAKQQPYCELVEEQLAEGRDPDRIGYFSFTKKATTEAIDRACKKFQLPEKKFKMVSYIT